MLSLTLRGRLKELWPTLWRTLLGAFAGAATVFGILLARGPGEWSNSPYGFTILLVSLVIGVLLFIVAFQITKRDRKASLQS